MFVYAAYQLWRGYGVSIAVFIHHRNFFSIGLLVIVLIAWLLKLGALYHSGEIVMAWRSGFASKLIQASH